MEGVCLCASGAELSVEFSITKVWIHKNDPPVIICVVRGTLFFFFLPFEFVNFVSRYVSAKEYGKVFFIGAKRESSKRSEKRIFSQYVP